VAFFAVSVDSLEENTKFAAKLDVNYPLLSDPQRRAAKAYGVVRDDKSAATRWTFYIGVDGKILDVDREVTPSTHGHDVVAKLAQLGVRRRAAR
jgi:peroxiredoxin Q/BCP